MILLILFGLAFAAVGVYMLIRQNTLKSTCTSQTTGTITGYDADHSVSDDASTPSTTTYFPTYVYTVNGLEYVKRSSSGSARPRHAVGQQVTVCYNPDDPHRHYIGGDKTLLILGVVFTIIGVAVVIAAFVAPLQ